MRKIKFHQIDSFTSQIFCGNSTATIYNAELLSESEMKKIAREMNHSESGFILPSKKADFRLRFFTPPGNEIKFCGHATIGALHTIGRSQLFNVRTNGLHQLQAETNAGILAVEIDTTDPLQPIYRIESPPVDLHPAPYSLEDVRAALQIPSHLIQAGKPLMIDRAQNYLYLTATSLKALGEISINFNSAKEFANRDGIVIFCILSPETFNPTHQVHSRGFGPWVGVPEDPFTGSMQGGLAAYLIRNEMISLQGRFIGSEQGHFMGRPGEAKIEVIPGSEFKIRLHAQAAHVFSAEMELE